MNSTNFFQYPTEPEQQETNGNLSFWADQPAEDWRTLLAHGETLRFAAGDQLIASNQQSDGFYLAAFGRFGMGDIVFEEGEAFGLESFFAKRAYPQAVVALEAGEVVLISRTAFETLFAKDPQLGKGVLLELGRILALKQTI